MFECHVCGLLSLKGPSCPGCGSQLRTDLSLALEDDDFVPTEVPGLEDAAESWYELEGMDRPTQDPPTPPSTTSVGSLPFGYQGQSNTYRPNLPFGIGSFAAGMPFDGQQESHVASPVPVRTAKMEPPITTPMAAKQPAPVTRLPSRLAPGEMTTVPLPPTPQPRSSQPSRDREAPLVPLPSTVEAELERVPLPVGNQPQVVEPPVEEPSSRAPESLEPVVAEMSSPEAVISEGPLPPVHSHSPSEPVRLAPGRLVEASGLPTEPFHESIDEVVPDYWRIDAPIPDYTTIYETPDEVVEVVHDVGETDVVVFQHEAGEASAVFHTPLEASAPDQRSSGFELKLHPAQALAVDVDGVSEHAEWLKEGYAGLASSNWGSAARAFQRLAGQRPQDASVMNNYGISLLQRAIAMAEASNDKGDPTVSAQFESAILALREAAKADPTNGDVLVNLAHALIESGRSEKALGIINVHNQRQPGDPKGLNTQAVALSQLGQMAQAKDVLTSISNDPVGAANLAQFTG